MRPTLPVLVAAHLFSAGSLGAEPMNNAGKQIEEVIVSASRISQPTSEISSNVARISGDTLKLISQIVHSVGGWIAFSAVIIIGPRIGKYSEANKGKFTGSSFPLFASEYLPILGPIIITAEKAIHPPTE